MLKKRWVAVVILLLVIGLSICFGLMRANTGTDLPATDSAQSLDTGLDTQSYTRFLYDKADLLSAQAEETICLYNATWDYRYNSVVAVVDASDIQIAEGREKLAASIQIPASTTIFATGSYSVECQVSASSAQD